MNGPWAAAGALGSSGFHRLEILHPGKHRGYSTIDDETQDISMAPVA